MPVFDGLKRAFMPVFDGLNRAFMPSLRRARQGVHARLRRAQQGVHARLRRAGRDARPSSTGYGGGFFHVQVSEFSDCRCRSACGRRHDKRCVRGRPGLRQLDAGAGVPEPGGHAGAVPQHREGHQRRHQMEADRRRPDRRRQDDVHGGQGRPDAGRARHRHLCAERDPVGLRDLQHHHLRRERSGRGDAARRWRRSISTARPASRSSRSTTPSRSAAGPARPMC